jgi:hypothetical protein
MDILCKVYLDPALPLLVPVPLSAAVFFLSATILSTAVRRATPLSSFFDVLGLVCGKVTIQASEY